MKRLRRVPFLLVSVALLGFTPGLRGHWLTQSFELQPGWNAVYLHVDASYATLDELVAADAGNPIQEIWLWQAPASVQQFITSPQLPTGSSSEWTSWDRNFGPGSSLQRLAANAACLVRVGGASPYTWRLKGKATPPRYEWTTTGLNFLGFSTPPAAPPSFEQFLSQAGGLLQAVQIYQYVGGELGPSNPRLLTAFRTSRVRRGEAFWMRAGSVFNRFFGPFELDLQHPAGVRFSADAGQYRVRLRNQVSQPLTVRLRMVDSETAPAGQPQVVGTPPVLVRGELRREDLTYGFSELTAEGQTWVLQPKGQAGSEVEIILGLNRASLAGNPGDFHGGVLRLTDSLNLSQVDIPVTAEVSTTAGLWIGEASVTQVQHYLQSYQRDSSGQPVVSDSGRYVVTGVRTDLGEVARPFGLRLILHRDDAGRVTLLQRVFLGIGRDAQFVVATQESALDPAQLSHARRISSVHLPWSASNEPWPMTGALQQGGTLRATVTVAYDDQAANPFLHTYHPDHDNLNATFDAPVERGLEAYELAREIQLSFLPPAADFDSLTRGGRSLRGDYAEVITFRGQGSEQRQFRVRGVFALDRVSEVARLTRP